MLSFDIGEDLQAIRETVHRFAEDEIRPHLRDFEAAGALTDAFIHPYLELGLTAVHLPEAQGGMGMGMRAAAVIQEELAWGDIGVANALPGIDSVLFALQELGTPEQLERLVNPDRANLHSCVALIEPAPGFQLADTWTLAEEDGDDYVLFGKKAFALNAGLATLYVVLAQTAPGSGFDGLRAFVIEPDTEGITAGERHHLLGLNTAHFGELELFGCRVPKANMLTGDGDLRGGLHRLVDRLRVVAGARIVGACRAAAEHAFKYGTEREAFGKPLYEHQGLSFMIADMATQIDIARLQLWRAAWAIDAGSPDAHRHVAMAFRRIAQLSEPITSNAVQLLGGHGYIQDHPVEKWMRDVRVQALIGGLEGFLTHDVADAELGVEGAGHAGSAGGVS
jgi:acyl-CoA dehydrogenase